jgi:DNA-binding transcriptional LysR family regulator
MNTKSLFYFVEAAKDMNFTQTAKRLYISQQALSQHIGKLESQYGVPLFIRKPQLMLSYAGETLLPHAEHLLHEEQLVESMFTDISDQEQGSLRISVTIPRCRLFLTDVVSKFKQRYPNVTLDVINPSTTAALDMVVKGDCNIAVGLLRKKHSDLELVNLTEDPWFLLVPDSLLRQYYSPEEIDQILSKDLVHLSMLARLPLIMANPMSDPEGAFPNHYYGSGATPNVLFTSSCPQNFLEFALEGISCIVASKMALLTYQENLPEHIHVLPLMLGSIPDHTSTISLAYNRVRHMPPYGEHFIKLVQEFFEKYNSSKA